MKHLPLVLCLVMSIVCIQVLGQRIGNQLLWGADAAQLSFEKEPCLQLQKRMEKRNPLPPGAHALWKVCVQNQVYEFSARTLEQMLPKFVDDEIKHRLKDVPSDMIPMVQFPSLKARVEELCRQNRFSNQYCDHDKYLRVQTAVYALWTEWMNSSDERTRLRGFQWSCAQEGHFTPSADIPEGIALMLNGCRSNKKEAIEQLSGLLESSPELMPLIALEARRLHAVSLKQSLKENRDRDELTQMMVDYALQGLED